MSAASSFMVIAGEASGDQYGARVIREIRSRVPDAKFFGVGGDRMRAEGAELLYHVHETSIMGFVEVARNYRFLRTMFARCEQALRERRPRTLILIDYPGFNLRFARNVRDAGVRIVYYISPQVWAWGKGRVQKMRPLVDHLACVFPFEEKIFLDAGIPTTFVGHPLLEILPDETRADFLARAGLPDERILAIFPGSRVQEIERMLPLMLESAARVRARHHCIIAVGAASLPDELYARHLRAHPDVRLLRGMTHGLMQHAFAAYVTSGTATVETACYGTPMLIVYRASRLNYAIGRHLINVEHIGMPNILAGRRIVPELVQHDATLGVLEREMLVLFENEHVRNEMRENLLRVRAALGASGASARVADIVLGSQDRPF